MPILKKGGYTKKYTSSKKMIKNIVRKELDNAIEDKVIWQKLTANYASIGSWNEQNICDPVQGTAQNQRIGKKVNVKAIEIKGVIAQGSAQAALDDAYNVVRVIIATWNAANNTPMATLEAATTGMINSPVKRGVDDYALLDRKLLDKYIPLNVNTTERAAGDGYTPQVKTFKYYKRFKKSLPILWSDNGNTYPNRRLILSCGSDSTAIPHPGFVSGYCIVHYEDA